MLSHVYTTITATNSVAYLLFRFRAIQPVIAMTHVVAAMKKLRRALLLIL